MKKIHLILSILVILTMMMGCAPIEEEPEENITSVIEEPTEPITYQPEPEPEPEPIVEEETDRFLPGKENPKQAVQSYIYYMTKARNGDNDAWEKALDYISPLLKQRTLYTKNVEEFKKDYEKNIDRFDNDGIIYGYKDELPFGKSYKVYFESSEGELFFTSDQYNESWHVYSASKAGAFYWPMNSSDGFE